MSKTRPHILKLAAAAFLFLSAGMSMSKAQDIIMPERWKTALTEVHPIFRQDTLTIRFLGDVMMHSAQIADAHRSGDEYDFSSYFRLIEDDIRDADIAVTEQADVPAIFIAAGEMVEQVILFVDAQLFIGGGLGRAYALQVADAVFIGGHRVTSSHYSPL